METLQFIFSAMQVAGMIVAGCAVLFGLLMGGDRELAMLSLLLSAALLVVGLVGGMILA